MSDWISAWRDSGIDIPDCNEEERQAMTTTPPTARPSCAICGEPMPEGEEMFKYHGFSGPCPKPPLPKATPRPDEDMRRVTASGDGQSKELCDWILGFLADECSLDQSCVSEADRSNIENAIENRISEVGAQLRQGSAICSAAKATEADGPTRPSSASTDYAALMEGLPGPWTYHHGLPPGSKIAEWWVESATGRLLAGKIKNKSLARAIAAIPDMVAEIGRLRQKLLDIGADRQQAAMERDDPIGEALRNARHEREEREKNWLERGSYGDK